MEKVGLGEKWSNGMWDQGFARLVLAHSPCPSHTHTHTQHHHLPAAGVIPIANDSGGPRADIVVEEPLPNGGQQRVGFLASTADEYAEAIAAVRCWG